MPLSPFTHLSPTPHLAPCWVSSHFLPIQFCSSSMAGAGGGHGALHSETCFLHSTWPAKRICITQFLCTGLKNLLLGKVNPQAHSQGAGRNINLFLLQPVKKPFQHLYPLQAACTKSSHLTLFFSIIGAEQAPFPHEVSSPAAGQVLLSFSGFSPAFQQPSEKLRSPGTQDAQGQAPQHSWCSTTAPGTAKGSNVPLDQSIPAMPPSSFLALCPSLAEAPGN